MPGSTRFTLAAGDTMHAIARLSLCRFVVPLALILATPAGAAPQPACLAPGTWASLAGPQPGATSPTALLTELSGRDVILLGEQHDDEDHHRWQLQTLAALHALRPDMAIGFEMFPRRVQPVLDRWVAGELDAARFLAEVEWGTVWSMPAEYYMPLFQFARINRIPMLALNIDRRLTRSIATRGWDAVPEAEREGVGRASPPSAAYRDILFGTHREHLRMRGGDAAGAQPGDAAFRNFVDSQIAWDRAMAEALARPLDAPRSAGTAAPLVVGIMGSGHIRDGHGVPHQLRDLGVRRIGSLLPVAATTACDELRPGLADGVFALPAAHAAAPEPPRLGVGLDAQEDGVRITEVVAGSLAEQSGLKAGDLIVEHAGQRTRQAAMLVAAVRRQPAGTWLPLRVKRGDATLDIIIRFPARS